jgi:hypothetical protein
VILLGQSLSERVILNKETGLEGGGGESLTGDSRTPTGNLLSGNAPTAILEREPSPADGYGGGVNGGAFPRGPKT